MVLKILVSSAKVATSIQEKPKNEPWGTPEVTGSAFEDTPNAVTL